jgi:hypothetical protein
MATLIFNSFYEDLARDANFTPPAAPFPSAWPEN